MKFLFFILCGIVGGIFGGMGMGGGTLLIPILTIFLSVKQHIAQSVNLFAFVPMAIVVLIIHIKNKYVKFKDSWIIILSGLAFSFLGCYVAKITNGNLLEKIFGGMLCGLSIFQFLYSFKQN